jgi:tetratricopeptide (TPR) repeat protein/peroxiredoxin
MRSRVLVVLVFVLLAARGFAQNSDAATLKDQIVKAEQLFNGNNFQAAVREFKRADDLAEGRSYDALIGLARTYRQLQEHNAAEDAALRAARVASDGRERHYAYWNAAMAAMAQGEKDAEKYKDAEREFRTALEKMPADGAFHTRYYLGLVLLKQSQDEAGVSELKKYVADNAQSRYGNSTLLKQAQDYIDNPHLARTTMLSPTRPAALPSSGALAVHSAVPTAATGKAAADPAVDDHLLKGDALLNRRRFEDALKEFKAAGKLAKENSFEAWLGQALAYQGLDGDKNAVEAALRAIPLAPNDKLRAHVHTTAGISLVKLGDIKAERYADAEREFRTALQLDPEAEFSCFNLGMVLLKQSRDEEGKAELQTYINRHPRSTRVEEAQRAIADPRRARELFMPDFSITTMDGQYIGSADLAGKVVVLDFWATWCGPCRASLGEVRSLAKHYAGKPVVLISISADTEKDKWRSFVQSNKMDWPQYLDERGTMRRLFGVHAFPSYMVVDSEGIVRKTKIGSGNFQVADIDSEVKKALKKLDESKTKPATTGS